MLYRNSMPAWIGIGYKKQEMLMEVVKAYVGKRFVVSGFTIPPELERVWPKVKSLIDAEVADAWRKRDMLVDFAEDEEKEDEK